MLNILEFVRKEEALKRAGFSSGSLSRHLQKRAINKKTDLLSQLIAMIIE